MVLRGKLSGVQVDQLKQECEASGIAHDGLTREQMRLEIMQYE